MSSKLAPRGQRPWWRDAVTYQIYIRSFADSNGDGIGDVGGIRSKLGYLKKLGVDAIWITPWYPSPQKDHGYDVADYLDIEPDYGTLEEGELLIKEAHDLGIKVIIDIVPNHTSDQHKWFKEALAAKPGSAARDRYIFREGKGKNGELPPNNWQAVFGGPAWKRVTESDGKQGQWYLHLFAVEQPDLNWENSEVVKHFEDVLKFWLDKGVDGFRIDVAHGMFKESGLPDIRRSWLEKIFGKNNLTRMLSPEHKPFWDQEGVHDIYRSWRKILDSYDGDRMAVAEAWVSPASRIARYVRSDELQNSFNFEMLTTLWKADEIRKKINNSIEALAEVGAPTSWVFNNHDVVRSVDRLDLGLTNHGDTTFSRHGDVNKLDIARGTLRAKSATLMALALPGGTYLYQGEELGLPEVRDIPEDRLTDPRWKMSDYKDRGRDGCRVPLPWEAGVGAANGFNTTGESWLPQPANYRVFSRNLQEGVAGSTLELYKRLLKERKLFGLGAGAFRWADEYQDKNTLAYINNGVLVLMNFGPSRDDISSYLMPVFSFSEASWSASGANILMAASAPR